MALFSPVSFHLNPDLHKPNRKPLPVSALPPLSTDTTTIAVLGGSSVAAIAAVISLTDPEKRRQVQAEEVGGGDKEAVREYFNNNGFQRWKKIYGDTDEVNKVQLDIRIGHSKMLPLDGVTVCDAGCGTGCLSIPLAKRGAIVSAMVAEAEKQAREELIELSAAPVLPKFEVKDLESLEGKYNTVVCLDVLIHYPQSAHLASLAEERLILSDILL